MISIVCAWHVICTSLERNQSEPATPAELEEKHYEDQASCTFLTGWQQPVCRNSFFVRHRFWRRLLPARARRPLLRAACAGGSLCPSVLPGSWLHLDRRLLVSKWPALCLAARLLGPSTVCRRLLGCSPLPRPSLLSRLLASPVTGTPARVFLPPAPSSLLNSSPRAALRFRAFGGVHTLQHTRNDVSV